MAKYQLIGDIALIKKGTKKDAEALMKNPYIKTVAIMKGVSGELRKPIVKRLAGNGFVTVHKEHNILYKLDVSKIMFSKGNVFERQRLVKKVKKNEVVIDMFAGIGYFSLGISKKAKRVYAIEKNPVSFRYLKENIKLNKRANIFPILEDCKNVTLFGNRILMGFFPHTEKFLPYAIGMIMKKGIIHYHNIYKKKDLWKKPIKDIEKACKNCSFKIIEKRKVKSYAPNVYHIVMDIEINTLKD